MVGPLEKLDGFRYIKKWSQHRLLVNPWLDMDWSLKLQMIVSLEQEIQSLTLLQSQRSNLICPKHHFRLVLLLCKEILMHKA